MASTHETATELVDTACKPDNNTRLKVGPQIITFLDGKGKLDTRQADLLVDAMTDWLQSSNFKVTSVSMFLGRTDFSFMEKYFLLKMKLDQVIR